MIPLSQYIPMHFVNFWIPLELAESGDEPLTNRRSLELKISPALHRRSSVIFAHGGPLEPRSSPWLGGSLATAPGWTQWPRSPRLGAARNAHLRSSLAAAGSTGATGRPESGSPGASCRGWSCGRCQHREVSAWRFCGDRHIRHSDEGMSVDWTPSWLLSAFQVPDYHLKLDDRWPESVEEQFLLSVNIKTVYYKTIYYRCIIGRREEEYQDNILWDNIQKMYETQASTSDIFTRKYLHPFHTDAFRHRRFYTQTLLHTGSFTHGRFHMQTFLHTWRFYTDAFRHGRFYTQTFLDRDSFTTKRFRDCFDAQTYTHTERNGHTNRHTHTHVHTHVHAHTHTQTHTHTHTDTQSAFQTLVAAQVSKNPWKWNHVAALHVTAVWT